MGAKLTFWVGIKKEPDGPFLISFVVSQAAAARLRST